MTEQSSSSTARKRKWDLDDSGNAAVSPHPPPPAPGLSPLSSSLTSSPSSRGDATQDKPTEAAAAAAARINAMLAAKGVPLKSAEPIKIPAPPRKEEPNRDLGAADFELDIDINDLKNRYMLTKGSTQKEIQAETGASITTRGVYYANREEATEKDPPLYLHIASNDEESMKKAEKRIRELMEIAQNGGSYPPRRGDGEDARTSPPPQFGRSDNPNMAPLPDRRGPQESREPNRFGPRRDLRPDGLRPGQVDCKVFVGMEAHNGAFNTRAKLIGPNGMFVKYIQEETGARVQIKGRGSRYIDQVTNRESDEDLHIHVRHNYEDGLEAAREKCEHLVQTVREQYEQWLQQRMQGPPRPGPGSYGPYGGGGYNQGHGPGQGGGYGGYQGGGYQDQQYGYPQQNQGPPPPSSAPPPPAPGYGGQQQHYQQSRPPPPPGPSTQPPPPPPSGRPSSPPPPPPSAETASSTAPAPPTSKPESSTADGASAGSAPNAGGWDLAAYTAYYSQMYPDHPEYAQYYAQQAMAQQQAAAQGGGVADAAGQQQQQQDWSAYYAYYYGQSAPAADPSSTPASAPPTTTTAETAAKPSPSVAGDGADYRAVPPPPAL